MDLTAQVKADNLVKICQRDHNVIGDGILTKERAAQSCSWKAAKIATFVSRDFERTLIER